MVCLNGVHVEAQRLMSVTTAVTFAVAFHYASGGRPLHSRMLIWRMERYVLLCMCCCVTSLFHLLLSICVFTLFPLIFFSLRPGGGCLYNSNSKEAGTLCKNNRMQWFGLFYSKWWLSSTTLFTHCVQTFLDILFWWFLWAVDDEIPILLAVECQEMCVVLCLTICPQFFRVNFYSLL